MDTEIADRITLRRRQWRDLATSANPDAADAIASIRGELKALGAKGDDLKPAAADPLPVAPPTYESLTADLAAAHATIDELRAALAAGKVKVRK